MNASAHLVFIVAGEKSASLVLYAGIPQTTVSAFMDLCRATIPAGAQYAFQQIGE